MTRQDHAAQPHRRETPGRTIGAFASGGERAVLVSTEVAITDGGARRPPSPQAVTAYGGNARGVRFARFIAFLTNVTRARCQPEEVGSP